MKKNRETDQMVLKGTEEEQILGQLSDRVERAIVTIQELRRERDLLQKRVDAAEEKLLVYEGERDRVSSIESDFEKLQSERTEIRNRIESILANLEELDEPEEAHAE